MVDRERVGSDSWARFVKGWGRWGGRAIVGPYASPAYVMEWLEDGMLLQKGYS